LVAEAGVEPAPSRL